MNIQEALSTLRNYRERCAVGLVVMGESAESDEMCQTVGRCYPVIVEAYLAEHDETPVDEAWLRSVALRFSDEMVAYLFTIGSRCQLWVRCYKGKCSWWLTDHSTLGGRVCISNNDLKTRGDVRRLCAALGVKLSEGTV